MTVLKEDSEKQSFRMYISELSKTIAQEIYSAFGGKEDLVKTSWMEIIKPKKPEPEKPERSAEEIKQHMIEGLNALGGDDE